MAQEYFSYQSVDVIQMVERKLDDLKPFQYDNHYRRLLGDVFVRRISEWERNIRNRKNDPFTLVVCGEFKRGKSSLINALLREDAVATNVTTETVTLNRISYGVHTNEAVFSSGRRMKISDEETQRDALEALMTRTGETIQRLEIKRPIDLLKTITIVDTPGLGDALQDFSEMVDYSLKQADAVIYVFNANYPLSQTEQLFLKTEVLPQKYTDLFLVANYSDMMPDMEGCKRMQSLLQQRIQSLLPGKMPLMLSALDERCLQCDEERPNLELQDLLEANFREFRSQLQNLVEQKQYMVLPDRMQRLLRAMAEDLNGLLISTERGLDMSEQDIQREVEKITQQCRQQEEQQKKSQQMVQEHISRMREESHTWMLELLIKMEQELGCLSGVPAEDLTKYYSFYCIDLIQEGMNRCLAYHTEKLYDELDDISFELTKILTKAVENKQYHFRFALDNQTWTKGDNVSYVASWLGLGALSLISDGIAGAMRQKEMKDQTPDLLRKIREQYRLLRDSVSDSIDTTYDRILKTVLAQLNEYHAEQIKAVQEQLEQSALVARQSAQEKEEIRQIITTVRNILGDIE